MPALLKQDITETAERVIRKVCQRHDCTPEDITGPRKPDHIVAARQMAYWILRLRGWKYPEIGEFFNRNHAAVMHGCLTVNNRFDIEDSWGVIWAEYKEFRVASNRYAPSGQDVAEPWL